MHFLIACPSCRRQFDVAGHPVGERFACSCGATLKVPRPKAHDAAVVRCSSCGATRQDAAESCRYCGADFTLHERDLDTLCSGCMARVSRRAHFCHFCGAPVLVRQAALTATDLPCPACHDGRKLASRRLGKTNVAIFECDACAGMWIEREIFEVLTERARAETLPDLSLRPSKRRPLAGQPPKGHFYRACVTCGTRMHRRNWGHASGIIVDVCQRHGVWFDAEELEALLRWLRNGGERQVAALEEAEKTAVYQQLARLHAKDGLTALGRSTEQLTLGTLAGFFLNEGLINLFE